MNSRCLSPTPQAVIWNRNANAAAGAESRAEEQWRMGAGVERA